MGRNPAVGRIKLKSTGHDPNITFLRLSLSRAKQISRSLEKLLGGIPLSVTLLTEASLGSSRKVIYLFSYQDQATDPQQEKFGYLITSVDQMSIHTTPVYVDGQDLRVSFKKNFEQRWQALSTKLGYQENVKSFLENWLDTYDPKQYVSRLYCPGMKESLKYQDIEASDVESDIKLAPPPAKKKGKEKKAKNEKVFPVIFQAPETVTHFCLADEAVDMLRQHLCGEQQFKVAEFGVFRNLPYSQLWTLNCLTNMILYPCSRPWVVFYAELFWREFQKGKLEGLLEPNGTYDDLKDFYYSSKFVLEESPSVVGQMIQQQWENREKKKRSYFSPEYLTPVQFKWTAYIGKSSKDDQVKIPVTFVANSYINYIRMSMGFASGLNEIQPFKADLIRQEFHLQDYPDTARVLILDLFPSSSCAVYEYEFLGIVAAEGYKSRECTVKTPGVNDILYAPDKSLLRVQFDDVYNGSLLRSNPLIDSHIRWRELIASILPREFEGELIPGQLSIRDIFTDLFEDFSKPNPDPVPEVTMPQEETTPEEPAEALQPPVSIPEETQKEETMPLVTEATEQKQENETKPVESTAPSYQCYMDYIGTNVGTYTNVDSVLFLCTRIRTSGSESKVEQRLLISNRSSSQCFDTFDRRTKDYSILLQEIKDDYYLPGHLVSVMSEEGLDRLAHFLGVD